MKVNAVPNEGSTSVKLKEATTSIPVSIEFTDINSMNQIPGITIKEEPIVSSFDSYEYGDMIKEEEEQYDYDEAAEVNEINNITIKQEENGVTECCERVSEKPQCQLQLGELENGIDMTESEIKNEINRKAVNLTCRYCNYEADGGISLRVHILSAHSTGTEHKCPMCNYTAKYRCSLSAHINCRHMNEKPYKCPMCSYSTAKKNAVKLHIMAKHTRDRPFKCNICADRFMSPSYCTYESWKRHMIVKHNTNYYT